MIKYKLDDGNLHGLTVGKWGTCKGWRCLNADTEFVYRRKPRGGK